MDVRFLLCLLDLLIEILLQFFFTQNAFILFRRLYYFQLCNPLANLHETTILVWLLLILGNP
jgi:hypothetical protein